MNVSEAMAQRYETSINMIPYDVIEMYGTLFGVNPAYILGWTEADIKAKRDSSNEMLKYITQEESELIDMYRKASDLQRKIAKYSLRLEE